MRPKLVSRLRCFAADASTVTYYCTVFLIIWSSTVAHAAENQSKLVTNYDESHLPFPLGPYNGLVVKDDMDETGELRGLDFVHRSPAGTSALGNNQYQMSDIKLGETQWWYFPKDAVSGNLTNTTAAGQITGNSKRSRAIYITLTACSKPSTNTADTRVTESLPLLDVYISVSEALQKPGPGQDSSKQTVYQIEDGYMGTTVEAEGNVYIGVATRNSTVYTGSYIYELAGSLDAFFHSVVEDKPFLYFVDSDMHAALFTTGNLTQAGQESQEYSRFMNMTPPYKMFVNNVNDTSVAGLHRSYCALNQHAQIGIGSGNINASTTSRGPGNQPKEQFYVTGLNQSSSYIGILAMDSDSGNGVIGGGGKVWKPTNFSTKTDGNCALLYDLSFCDEVAYAVPSNPSIKTSDLRSIYDDNAVSLYKNFSYSLEQIQCNATNETRYSLAVGCNDCAKAYRQWLCAVTIPRCEDFSSTEEFLQIRNAGQEFMNGTTLDGNHTLRLNPATNQSRNPLIDNKVRPGPYKEILPCEEFCYDLVKSCPAALEFSCPQGRWLSSTYGTRDPDGFVTCSWLGAAYFINGVDRLNTFPLGALSILVIAQFTYWVFES